METLQNKSLELSLFLSLPATLALIFASEEIVSALFGYGSFNEESVKNSALALFYFALEKVAGINHVIRHVELDTPYFDVEIQEDFIFSVLSSLHSSFNTMNGIASDIDELGSDSNLQLDIVSDQYLTIQSSLDEAQKEDENHIEYFFEEIVFHPLEVRLTYRGSASGSTKKLSSLNRKSRGLGALSSLPSIDDLVVIFSSLQQW